MVERAPLVQTFILAIQNTVRDSSHLGFGIHIWDFYSHLRFGIHIRDLGFTFGIYHIWDLSHFGIYHRIWDEDIWDLSQRLLALDS